MSAVDGGEIVWRDVVAKGLVGSVVVVAVSESVDVGLELEPAMELLVPWSLGRAALPERHRSFKLELAVGRIPEARTRRSGQMKIKVINPNTNRAMTAKIAEAACAVACPGTELLVVQSDMGPLTIDTAYDDAFAAVGVIDEVRKGEREGCDGYVIACFGDPGLWAAREVARGPVIGMGEAAMHAAGMIGGGFSIISMPERCRADMIRRVRACGMAPSCRSIRLVDVTVLESEDDRPARERLLAECHKAVDEDGADCIVLGCSGLTDLAAQVSREIGAPAIDGVTVAVKFAEALAALGLGTSKRQGFGFPIPKPFTGLFSAFGSAV